MKKLPVILGVTLGFALLVTGCETDNSSARIQEKSAVYATLKPWQKKYVDTGVVAMGFSPDMVYMAIGNPTTKTPAGPGELWVYKNYYPSVGADRVKTTLTTESTYANSNNLQPGMPGSNAPSVSRASGGPQGGSMEPADLASYTFYITFENGVVTKMKLDPN